MKKLRLRTEEVTVLSFPTGEVPSAGGTVVGNAISTRPCGPETEYYTCGFVCLQTRDQQYTSPCLCQ